MKPRCSKSLEGARRPLHQSRRKGVMMVEAIIAALLIGTAVGLLLPGVSAVKQQRLSQRFEVLSLVELNNIAASFKGSEAPSKLSPWFEERYKAAVLDVEPLTDPGFVPESSDLKAIRLSIRRPMQKGTPDQRVSIVVWKNSGEPTP